MQDEKLRALLERVKNKDDAAFEELAEMYSPLLYSVAVSFNESAAAVGANNVYGDLLQDLNLALYKAAQSFDLSQDKVTFGLYAKRCVNNRAISFLRKEKSIIRRETRMKEKLKREIHFENRFLELGDAEREDLVEKIAPCLSSFEFRVFKMYLDGQRAREIAEIVGKSEKSVNNAIFRSKNKIRKYLYSD